MMCTVLYSAHMMCTVLYSALYWSVMGRGLAHLEKMFWGSNRRREHLPYREQMYYML